MVDINEANDALYKMPDFDLKQRKSFTYKIFFEKSGAHKNINIVDYTPGMQADLKTITLIRNMRVKLQKNYVLQQDVIFIPSKSGHICIPLEEVSEFSSRLKNVINIIGEYHEK